jgi:murein DD-endopeptidase MepM/ murein hydrolase activator NlpD
MATITKTEVPLWQEDGPTHYFAAFNYHKPWVKSGPYITPLSETDEPDFEDWVNTFNVPCDIPATVTNYDFRGYWVARVKGTSTGWSVVERLPDFWLTPYSTMFSVRSVYARVGCPYHWTGDKLFDESNGLLLFWADYAPPKDTAVNGLAKSKVDPRAVSKGLMGEDLDMENFRLYIWNKLRLKADDQISDATVVRSIEGASTVTITLDDNDRTILRSGLLSRDLDFQLDGMWWQLAQVAKDEGDQLTLTFETREIARLRRRVKFIQQARDDYHTRARFILRMIRELKETPDYLNVPVVIPELKIVQKVAASAVANPDGTEGQDPGSQGIDPNQPEPPDSQQPTDPRKNLTVKGVKAQPYQIKNANLILAEGFRLNCTRKIIVCSIMVAITENLLKNDDMEGKYIGLFQQDEGWGTFEERMDPTHAANAFFRAAIQKDRNQPDLSYNDLCQAVQVSSFPNRWGQYKGEAENWVTAYMLSTGEEIPQTPPNPLAPPGPVIPGTTPPTTGDFSGNNNTRTDTGGNAGGQTFLYYRGIPGDAANDWGEEDSWTCILRLAREVNWRAFFVGGTFWYIEDVDLFNMKPIMTISESSAGIDSISFDYDNNKKNATVTVKARIGRWLAQPGAVVRIQNEGPINGKWLVTEFERSLFDLTATIILKKPLPELPEAETNAPPELPDPVSPPPTTGPFPSPIPGPIPDDYKNPFRDVIKLYPGRIDNGVDYAGTHGSPIYAIGPAKIGYFNPDDSWGARTDPAAGARMAYTFTSGPARGLTVFVAEYINLNPGLRVGSIIGANTVIATFGGSGAAGSYTGDGIEIGWATSSSDPNPLANAYGGQTELGTNFSQFLTSLGAPGGHNDPRGRTGNPLPPLWPQW